MGVLEVAARKPTGTAAANLVDIINQSYNRGRSLLFAMSDADGCSRPGSSVDWEWRCAADSVDIIDNRGRSLLFAMSDADGSSGPGSSVDWVCNFNCGIGPGTNPRWVQKPTNPVDIIDFTRHSHG